MIAVSESLLQLLIELQSIPSLNDFYLAGGTSIAEGTCNYYLYNFGATQRPENLESCLLTIEGIENELRMQIIS